MPQPSVAIRLGTEGGARVKNDFAEVGQAGENAAKRLGDAFDREAQKAERSRQRMADTAAKIAAIAPQTAIQMRINEAVGSGYSQPEGSARRSAQAMAELIQQQERLEQRVHMFRAALEPAYAAQARFNQEMAEAKALISQGAISLDMYCDKLRLERTLLDQSTQAGQRHNVMSGEQRAGMAQLTMNLNDMATMWSLGAKPQQIFASQSGQVIQAIALMQGGASRFTMFMMGPWGAAIQVGLIALIPLVGKLLEGEDALKKVEFATYSFGDAQGILGSVMDLTTGKITTQSTALLGLARAQALAGKVEAMSRQAGARRDLEDYSAEKLQIGGGPGGLAISTGYRPYSGVLDAFLKGDMNTDQAVKQLDNLRKIGQLTESQFLEAAKAVTSFGVETENISVFENANAALDGDQSAIAGFIKPKNTPKPKVDRRAETLARESAATESLIANLGKLADAYLSSDAAAMKAEITAKAMEQGIKKQADVSTYVAQQMRLEVAKRTADAAKTIAGLKQETDYRSILNNQVEQGLITSEEALRLMQQDAQLRPFITAAAVAEGDSKQKLLTIIQQLREEQTRSNDETLRERQLRTIADQGDAMGLAEREAALIFANDNDRQRGLSMLRMEQQLRREGNGLLTEEGERILANNEAILRKNEAIARMADDWREAQQIGENFIDTVLDVSNWDDWGDIGKRVLNDLMNDMIRLAAINPLKNMLFGSDLPTLGGVAGAIGGLFSGRAGLNAAFDAEFGVGRNAAGTERWSGGMTWIAENGPELVNLPEGSKITPAHRTRRLLANDNAPVIHIDASIHAAGADSEGLARVEAAQRQMARELPSVIVATVNKAMGDRLLR